MPITKVFKFKGLDGVEYNLSLKEKLFCEKYLELKGNGVEAVIQAGYKVKSRMIASSLSYEYLIKPHISNYITKMLEEYGFNDDNVTKQHLYLINQFGDLKSKGRGIDMFYKLKGSYAAEKIKIIDKNGDLTDEQIDEEIEELEGIKKKQADTTEA